MKRVLSSLMSIGATALVALASGCGSIQSTEDMLATAGFKSTAADTHGRQVDLAILPPHQISRTTRDGATYYVYSDPNNSVLYVGGQSQFDRYQNLRVQNQMARDELAREEINSTYWGAWGPWGPWDGW
jgi:hypothetical protein